MTLNYLLLVIIAPFSDGFEARHLNPLQLRNSHLRFSAFSEQDPEAVAVAAARVAARRAESENQTSWDKIVQARCSGNPIPESAFFSDDVQKPGTIDSPMRWVGPYPALALSFPKLATAAQKLRSDKGITLDFVVDTASNVNTINALVAQELALARVGSAPAGVGAGGAIAGGFTYLLGDAELGDLPTSERFIFMEGLTASALPVASPAAAGILGLPFFFSFPGGVEFKWGDPRMIGSGIASGGKTAELKAPSSRSDSARDLFRFGMGSKSLFDEDNGSANEKDDEGNSRASNKAEDDGVPTITFWGDAAAAMEATAGLAEVPCEQLPSGLLKVDLALNGVIVPALLDTGSPITVLNRAAAKAVGLAAPVSEKSNDSIHRETSNEYERNNPLRNFVKRFKGAQKIVAGEVLVIAGTNGQPVELHRTSSPATSAALGSANLLKSTINNSIEKGLHCYVGELPGLAALDGLGESATPAAVLGLDVLRRCERLVLADKKVYVSERS